VGPEAGLRPGDAPRRAAHPAAGDEAIAEILLEQSRRFPERREVLERWLDRCELRDRALHEEITTTGERLLKMLA
jgi:hypothetical protein